MSSGWNVKPQVFPARAPTTSLPRQANGSAPGPTRRMRGDRMNTPGNGPPRSPFHAHRCLERFALPPEVVATDPDIEDPERARVPTLGAHLEVSGEKNQAGAGRQGGDPRADRGREGLPQARAIDQVRYRGGLAARQEQSGESLEVRRTADRSNLRAQASDGPGLLRYVPLQGEHADDHPAPTGGVARPVSPWRGRSARPAPARAVPRRGRSHRAGRRHSPRDCARATPCDLAGFLR